MAAEYYTVKSVRKQILRTGKLEVVPVGFPHDWELCPCATQCRITGCHIVISVFFNLPHISISVIEIIYIKEKQRGFIRVDHTQLNRLIEKGVVDASTLEKVSF